MRVDPAEAREELAVAAATLERSLAGDDLPAFYAELRGTHLPFLAAGIESAADARELFRLCYEILHRFGGISPAVALALENHLYVSAALATLPLADDPPLDARRRALLADGGRAAADRQHQLAGPCR